MAVPWSESQESRVRACIARHPVDSSRCAELAGEIRAVGAERDSDAHILRIRPVGRLMRFVVPRVTLPSPWTHHMTTAVEDHGVDALTGAPGTAWRRYLDTHFEYSDAVVVERWTGDVP